MWTINPRGLSWQASLVLTTIKHHCRHVPVENLLYSLGALVRGGNRRWKRGCRVQLARLRIF